MKHVAFERTSWQAEHAATSPSGVVNCVFLSCFDQDVLFFASILGQANVRIHRADSLEAADFLMLATAATAFVLDTAFLDGTWKEALAMAREFHPMMATLLCADTAEEDLVAAAREHGLFGVLRKPVESWQLRSGIWAAHELTLERQLWLAAREAESRA